MNAKDLLDAGYPPGPRFDEMLLALDELQARGVTGSKYLLKLLKRRFGDPPPRFVMREAPLPCAEAIRATTTEEKANLAKVRDRMSELLAIPVIRAGALMPDACPTGSGPAVIPVGGAIAVENAIIPSAHSADICCSLFASFYKATSEVARELDALTTATRFGPGGRRPDDPVSHPVLDEDVWENPFLRGLQERARIHLADQGDGNHFAFIGEIEIDDALAETFRKPGHDHFQKTRGTFRVLVTHHGSRSLGSQLYLRGQEAALRHVATHGRGIPEAAAWLDASSPEGGDYWEALQFVARWTRANHECIHERFLERIGAEAVESLGNEHNFVWKRGDLYYHGKGATPAWKDEQGRPLIGLIPLNMAEPILLVLGNDREEFLSFAPHGAGRNLSRTALRKKFRSADQRRHVIDHHTRKIDVRWFGGIPDLTETPIAYKNAAEIKAQIREFDLATIVAEIKPLGCLMAGRFRRPEEEELTPKQIRQIGHRAERRRVRQELRWEE